MKNNIFISQLGEYFETYLPEINGASKHTISSYSDAFALLFKFFYEKKQLPHHLVKYKHFTLAMFDELLLWMENECKYSNSSKRQRLSAITSFLKYASRREMSALNAYSNAINTDAPSAVCSGFPYFTIEETKILLASPNPNKRLGKRDRVLISFLYDTAARSQEICDVCVGDIRFGNTTKVKLHGKGSKTREIPISDEVADLLRYHFKNYNLSTTADRSKPLFSSQTNIKMTTACIRNLTKKYVELCKAENPTLFCETKYSPHSFRHSKAVHMVEAGTSLIYIRNFLGHASIKSTEIYARVGQAAVTKALTERKIPRLATVPDYGATSQSDVSLPDFIQTAR